MQIYLVGGAVRDGLLGLPVSERDYLVVGADAAQLLALGFRRLDPDFPVFRHPETGDEYALARRERKVGPGYKGFVVEVGPDVTLEQDLARRDLTINALAQDPDGHIIDPFHGRDDLQAGLLRHITPAFREDPLRLLRIARFAARLGRWGFQVAPETFDLLRAMAAQDELTSLIPQRLREELFKALAAEQPWRFFETLQDCGALRRLLPSLAVVVEEPPDQGAALTTPMATLRRATAQSPSVSVRFAALIGAALADPSVGAHVCQGLGIERNAADLLTWIQTWPASRVAQATPETLLGLVEGRRLLHHPEWLDPLAQVWTALDLQVGARAATRLATALQASAGVRAEGLRGQGLAGPALGAELRRQRMRAIQEAIGITV